MHVVIDGASYSKPAVPLDKVEFLRREWEVGDLVRNTNDHDDVGEVVASQDWMVWVKLRSGAFATFEGAVLEPAPSPAEEAAAFAAHIKRASVGCEDAQENPK